MIQKIHKNSAVLKYLQRDGLINQNILSYLEYDKNAEILTFSGDVERGIIVAQKIYADDADFMIATIDEEFLRTFWEYLPNGDCFFTGVAKSYYDAFISVSGTVPTSQNLCKVYTYNGGGVFKFIDSLEYEDDVLNDKDADIVHEFYPYQHEESFAQIRRNIAEFDTSCIRIDDELVSWCLMHEDGSLGPFYTKEAHRRKGLGELVSARLIQKLVKKDKTPFVHIVYDNTNPLALVEKHSEMEYTHDCVWFTVKK
ncbi:MAG: GNAT family N-acetyltransferase [Defluviitaleaceae bacterium]|nr:GNAT family N-acetyltransferase [Defluviitaleaceae bacterium]